MDSYRFPDRQGFPDSYRAFIRHAGWARTFGLWLIYPPVLPGFADGWQGRARNLTEAILWHGGEAQTARDQVINLPPADRTALIRYLESL